MVENQLMLSYIQNAEVLNVTLKVPRHLFANSEHKQLAFSDSALSLTHKQTISQPSIVALKTQRLGLDKMVLPFAEFFFSQNLIVFAKKRALGEKFITGVWFTLMASEF